MTLPIFPELKNLLLCTDGSDYSEGAIREGIMLAKNSGAALTVLSVIDFNPEFEALAPDLMEKMETQVRDHLKAVKERAEKDSVNCRAFTSRSAAPYLEIAKEAGELGAQLIVMGRRGRTGLKRLLMGSVTKRVIGHSPCSVLVVPRDARIKCGSVLAATDGSRFGEAAVKEATAIAKRCGSDLAFISVVHAESASPFDIVHSQMQRSLIAESEMKNSEAAIEAAKTLAIKEGIKATGLVMAGRIYETIVETAAKRGTDLIVVGSHGRTGIESILMGSVAERVVGHAGCAVLVVKI